MKKIYTLIILSLITVSSWGQLLFHEPFNYVPDPVLGLSAQSDWTWRTINTGDSILIESGNLSYPGLAASTGNRIKFDQGGTDYYRIFTTQTSVKVYASFIFKLTSLGTLNTTNGGYFAGFIDGTTTTNFGATVWVRSSATAGKFNIGIAPRTGTATISWLPDELDLNTNYFVVTSYELISGTGNDIVELWLNPANIGSTEPASHTSVTNTAGTDLTAIGKFLIRQDNATNTAFVEMDELRVGNSWASVTPTGVVIPDPTTTSISPSSAVAGTGGFTLTVQGTNFVSGSSTVTWNGNPLTTSFVTATELTAIVPAANIAAPGTAQVGVTTTGASAVSNTQTFTINPPPNPLLTASPLTAFGEACINTSDGPHSFIVSGTNLTSADVTVGPLPGYSFSTTAAGTYSGSLSIAQPGGSFSQEVFVKFEPVAVQSYNGNIVVGGGGASSINVAASGSGINTLPAINAGAANTITTTGATLPATITITGCGAVTSYGFEYSTTSGFANGTGTQVAGSNLSGNNFSVVLSSLNPTTTYYYKAYATNAAGTSYSSEQSFTTSGVLPVAPVATAATNITSTSFTANWNAVAGATSYFLDVYTMGTGGVDTIAGWNFATNTQANQVADEGNANNLGIQTISPVGLGTISWPGGPTSTTGTNPYTVSATGWDNGVESKYWIINVNTIGASGLTLSSLQGSSNTGPGSFKIQYRVGASGTWTDIPGGTVNITVAPAPGNAATFFGPADLPLPSAVDNQPEVSIRWTPANTTSVNGGTVASGGTSRISAIYIKAAGTGTVPIYVPGYQNLDVGNVTSYNVTSLSPSTNYYYVVRAANSTGASPNSNEIAVVTSADVTPSFNSTTLAGFGNVCVNPLPASNSFTLNGSNLTSADITIGPLDGFSFSTTSGGTFTNSLTLTQPGGSFSQVIYVRFNPTAVQSYNGNIPVAGGGVASTFNIPVTGAGVNTVPTVVTGSATSVTHISATLGGSITSNGCSAITAYGIEYSTVNNFPEGTGTQVPSTNLSGQNFSAPVTGLNLNTIYYYRAFATNSGGTAYGALQNFTTLATPPVVLTATVPESLGAICVNTTSAAKSFTLTGSNLTTADVVVGPLTGYSFSTSLNGTYTASLSIAQPGGNFNQQVFVKLTPVAAQSYNGNIPVSGGGSTPFTVAVVGSGVNTPPSAVTGNAENITTRAALVNGSISGQGCSPLVTYGVEYSGMPGFTPGTGSKLAGNNLSNGNFSVQLNDLVQGTTYYYRAFASNAGATAYGDEMQFTAASIPASFTIYPVPVQRGGELFYSIANISQGNHTVSIFNSMGQEVVKKNLNVQGSFINQSLSLPFNMAPGVYHVRLNNDVRIIDKKTILVY